MKCFSLILGARNTPAAGRKFSKEDDELIRDLTGYHFPEGFTILNADGGWFDPGRKVFVEEEARQILICTSDRETLRGWCAALARALRQKELLVVELGVARTFRYRNAMSLSTRRRVFDDAYQARGRIGRRARAKGERAGRT